MKGSLDGGEGSLMRGGKPVQCKHGIDDQVTVIKGARVEQVHKAHMVVVAGQAGMTEPKSLGQVRRRGYCGDHLRITNTPKQSLSMHSGIAHLTAESTYQSLTSPWGPPNCG